MTRHITKAEPRQQTVIQAFRTDLATIQAAIAANIGSGGLSEFDLTRIKIPSGGGLQWPVPSLEGEIMESVIEGVIVLVCATRAYYSQPMSEGSGNHPPDCSSSDGISGTGKPGGHCALCP